MSDKNLRCLERRASLGGEDDQARLVLERYRVGELSGEEGRERVLLARQRLGSLSKEQLQLLAFFGDAAARRIARKVKHTEHAVIADLRHMPGPCYCAENEQIYEETYPRGIPFRYIEAFPGPCSECSIMPADCSVDAWASCVFRYGGWQSMEICAVELIKMVLPFWSEHRESTEVQDTLALLEVAIVNPHDEWLIEQIKLIDFGDNPALWSVIDQNDESDQALQVASCVLGVWVSNPDLMISSAIMSAVSLFRKGMTIEQVLLECILPRLRQSLIQR